MNEPSTTRTPTRLRRAAVGCALVLVAAIVPTVTRHAPSTSATRMFAPAHGAHDAPTRVPDVERGATSVPQLVAAHPLRQSHAGLGLALFLVALAAAAVRRRHDLRRHARFRDLSAFARRRGPPSLLTVS